MLDLAIQSHYATFEPALTTRLAMTAVFEETFKRAKTVVTPLNTDGEKTPVFWVHSIGGAGTDPIKLCKLLGPDRPFYSVRAPSNLRNGEFGRSVPAMSTLYISELSALYPDGPLILGAFSAGVVIALEMAQQLRAIGRDVRLLVAVDFAPFNTGRGRSPFGKMALEAMFLARLVCVERSVHGAWSKVRRRLTFLFESLSYEHASDNWATRLALTETETAFVRALYDGVESYVPGQYEGAVVLYLAHSRKEADLGVSSPKRSDLLARWKAVAANLTAVDVFGDHHSILIGEDVDHLASDLRKRLDGEQAGGRCPLGTI